MRGFDRGRLEQLLARGFESMPAALSLVGTTIGRIRFESLLGRGGMGEVYRAFDEKLQRVVAVKTIRPEHRLSGTARSRFLREARMLSKLANPLICQVYDLIEAEEGDLLVLEFVEGETLDQLRAGRSLAEREVLELGAKIAEALAVLHRERIIHRDLKPANIMVLPSGGSRSSTSALPARARTTRSARACADSHRRFRSTPRARSRWSSAARRSPPSQGRFLDAIFADDLETADTSRWSATIP